MLKDVTIGRTESTIISGVVTAVNADTITVTAPVKASKLPDGSWKDTEVRVISKTNADGQPIGEYVVGQPFVGFIYEADSKDKFIAERVIREPKVTQFENKVKNVSDGSTRTHNDALIVATLTKATQVMVNAEKKCVSIPFNQPDGEPSVFIIWRDNPKSKYGPHWADQTNKDNKTVYGLETYAKRLKERLDRLKDGEVLMITYTGRFETSEKQADGTWKNVPAKLTEKDGKQMYTLFASSESSLGDIQRTACGISSAYAIKNKFEKSNGNFNASDHSFVGAPAQTPAKAPAAPAQAPAAAPAPVNNDLAAEVADAEDEEELINSLIQGV